MMFKKKICMKIIEKKQNMNNSKDKKILKLLKKNNL